MSARDDERRRFADGRRHHHHDRYDRRREDDVAWRNESLCRREDDGAWRNQSRPRRWEEGDCHRRHASPSPPMARRGEDAGVDEFGRKRPPPRDPSPERDEQWREEERRQRKERRREKREERRSSNLADGRHQHEDEEARRYQRSLFPPGDDLSRYTYDPSSYWYVTTDGIWYFRPDLSLWYDCRHASYFTFDPAIQEYVSVDSERATRALAEGRSVAPQIPYADADTAVQQASPSVGLCQDAAAKAPSSLASLATAPSAARAAAANALPSRLSQLVAHTESWMGKKDVQEDRYVESIDLPRLGGVLYGIFDGHGGCHAAEYAAKHLPADIARCVPQSQARPRSSRQLLDAMADAFPRTDRELISAARRKGHHDGTTALVAVVFSAGDGSGDGTLNDLGGGEAQDDEREALELCCAHVGDCRAVLCRDGHALRLTDDHRPDRRDEQQRVRAAGGAVLQVSGIWRCTTAAGAARALDKAAGFDERRDQHTYLSCSRTLGDEWGKAHLPSGGAGSGGGGGGGGGSGGGGGAAHSILSNVPETSSTPLREEDLFFVLACDGIWDVLSDQDVVDLVLDHWGDAREAASAVVRRALTKGSSDNLTAQVVLLGGKHEQGVAIARRRATERAQEEQEARWRTPVERGGAPSTVDSEEGEIDMFA